MTKLAWILYPHLDPNCNALAQQLPYHEPEPHSALALCLERPSTHCNTSSNAASTYHVTTLFPLSTRNVQPHCGRNAQPWLKQVLRVQHAPDMGLMQTVRHCLYLLSEEYVKVRVDERQA